ncbi:MAG: acyl-CoA carboxylase subunit epsilon [Chloroflexota bacterium]|nr:acyl-CoA carboxylase subunit epsilon [Chloroflexota bacterium]
MPVHLVRGNASPEELAAIVAILATARGNGAPHPTSRRTSPWGSPGRMVRSPHSHGPGGWRASALPR